MKIAIISTTLLDTPPKRYGGLERVNYDLACGLVERGHKVALFASDDSQAPEGAFLFRLGKAEGTVNVNWLQKELDALQQYREYLPLFDAVLSSDWFGAPYLAKAENPDIRVAHTHHGHMDPNWWKQSEPPFKLNLIAISRWMRSQYRERLGYESQVAYNPVPVDDYTYKRDKGDRYLFLGRIDPIKGPHLAIKACRLAGVKLDVAGATSFVADKNYVEQVKSLCDGDQVRFIGEVSHEEKARLLSEARGLIVASQFGEPFGLMVVEALASGTPVYALRDGAIPEIITDDVGVVADTVGELAVRLGEEFTPERCRERAECFSVERAAERYEQLLTWVAEGYDW